MTTTTRVMRETKVLRCYLTRDERLERGQRVAELTYTIDGLEAEKKAEADRYNGKIREAEGLRKQLSGVLRDGYEMRPTDEMDLRSALASGWLIAPTATARTLSRVVAIKRELRRRGLIVDLDAVPPEEERQEKRSGDAHCVTCHHAEHVHGDALQGRSSACMAIGCTCKRFVAADPLGVDDYDPAAEKGAAPCDSAS